jgi:hypothetical protein
MKVLQTFALPLGYRALEQSQNVFYSAAPAAREPATWQKSVARK